MEGIERKEIKKIIKGKKTRMKRKLDRKGKERTE